MTTESELEQLWHDLLTDPDHPAFKHARRHALFWKHIPGDPRCKMCKTPLAGPATPLLKLTSRARSPNNPNFCNACNTWTNANPGGAEVELSFLFADVRGSTPLAQEIGTAEFARLMNRFYEVANRVLVASDAWIDKPVGDEVRGFYLMEATGHTDPDGPWLPMGAGVHTGDSYVGAVGVEGSKEYDVTALGDTVNTVARLASAAAEGEILVSQHAVDLSGLDLSEAESRTLELKGRADALPVRVLVSTPLAGG